MAWLCSQNGLHNKVMGMRGHRAVVPGPAPGARQEGGKHLVMCEMVCPRDKVGMDFPGFLLWKRAG